ncbi:MAG TPA: IPT/TIG domain-containing protein [Rugosimonospora sp.]|nr:IPT/TIG domain-containing protein [Rugosimonospora sp.]
MRKKLARSLALRVGVMFAVVVATVGAIATPSYAVGTLTLSSAKGPDGGGNSITATASGATLTTSGMAVLLSLVTCPAYPASVSATNFTYTSGVVSGGPIAATGVTSTTTAVTFTVPSTLQLPSNVPSVSMYVCAYTATTAATAVTAGTSAAGYTVVSPDVSNTLKLAPHMGPSGSGTVVATTWDVVNAVAGPSYAVGTVFEFQYGTCNVAWQAAATITSSAGIVPVTTATLSTNTATITVPSTLALLTTQNTAAYSLCAYSAATTTGTLLYWTAPSGYMLGTTMTVSPANGPSGGGNTVIATAPSGTFQAGTVVEFQVMGTGVTGNCSAVYTTPATGFVASTDVRVLSDSRLAIVVPSISSANGYNVCAYGTANTSSVLVAGTAGIYTVAAAATVTSISPISGPAMGNTTITVFGTNLAGVTSVTLGGTVLTPTRVTSTSFAVVTQAHVAGGPYSLIINSPSGLYTFANAYTFTNGIQVMPDHANNTGNVDLDVTGVGFVNITFTSTDTSGANPNTNDGHVYLVPGAYDPTPVVTAFKTVAQRLECLDVLVVSDTELVCTMWLAGNQGSSRRPAAPSGTSVITTLGSTAATTTSATFSQSDVGLGISDGGTNFAPGTYIAAVNSPTSITLSTAAPAGDGSTPATVSYLMPRTITDGATTSGSATVGTAGAASTDVGRLVSGPGIPAGTTITAVTTGGSGNITLSNAATVTGTSVSVAIGPLPVMVGTYTVTIVNDGRAVDESTNVDYIQSVISSGSTFTVAPY